MTKLIIRERETVPNKPTAPKVSEELCIGCGVCARVCPVPGVIRLSEEEVLPGITMVIAGTPASPGEVQVAGDSSKVYSLPEYCIECRRCVEECPADAMSF